MSLEPSAHTLERSTREVDVSTLKDATFDDFDASTNGSTVLDEQTQSHSRNEIDLSDFDLIEPTEIDLKSLEEDDRRVPTGHHELGSIWNVRELGPETLEVPAAVRGMMYRLEKDFKTFENVDAEELQGLRYSDLVRIGDDIAITGGTRELAIETTQTLTAFLELAEKSVLPAPPWQSDPNANILFEVDGEALHANATFSTERFHATQRPKGRKRAKDAAPSANRTPFRSAVASSPKRELSPSHPRRSVATRSPLELTKTQHRPRPPKGFSKPLKTVIPQNVAPEASTTAALEKPQKQTVRVAPDRDKTPTAPSTTATPKATPKQTAPRQPVKEQAAPTEPVASQPTPSQSPAPAISRGLISRVVHLKQFPYEDVIGASVIHDPSPLGTAVAELGEALTALRSPKIGDGPSGMLHMQEYADSLNHLRKELSGCDAMIDATPATAPATMHTVALLGASLMQAKELIDRHVPDRAPTLGRESVAAKMQLEMLTIATVPRVFRVQLGEHAFPGIDRLSRQQKAHHLHGEQENRLLLQIAERTTEMAKQLARWRS